MKRATSGAEAMQCSDAAVEIVGRVLCIWIGFWKHEDSVAMRSISVMPPTFTTSGLMMSTLPWTMRSLICQRV